MNKQLVTSDLLKLRAAFQKHGFDVRFVGGCVRDMLKGHEAKDIDLCTDAFPDEQKAIYEAEGFHYIATGEQHGTYTVMIEGEGYEITSLRTEDEHDGRYAKMTYTRDWVEDLSRRDLTINAMAMTFDGELIDPFGGKEDLRNSVVRFVGDPNERMREDYLRILRYFRFLGRYGLCEMDAETEQAVQKNVAGLIDISPERIWAETKKILAHDTGPMIYGLMNHTWVIRGTPLPPSGGRSGSMHIVHQYTRNPVSVLCALIGSTHEVEEYAKALKWSREEKDLALAIVRYRGLTIEALYRQIIVNGDDKRIIAEVARYNGSPYVAKKMEEMIVPVMPVTGKDLMDAGYKPGPDLGEKLKQLKDKWFRFACTLTKEELMML